MLSVGASYAGTGRTWHRRWSDTMLYAYITDAEDSRNVTCWSLYIERDARELVKSCLRDITSCLHDPYMIPAIVLIFKKKNM